MCNDNKMLIVVFDLVGNITAVDDSEISAQEILHGVVTTVRGNFAIFMLPSTPVIECVRTCLELAKQIKVSPVTKPTNGR